MGFVWGGGGWGGGGSQERKKALYKGREVKRERDETEIGVRWGGQPGKRIIKKEGERERLNNFAQRTCS